MYTHQYHQDTESTNEGVKISLEWIIVVLRVKTILPGKSRVERDYILRGNSMGKGTKA